MQSRSTTEYSLAELARRVGGEVRGNPSRTVRGIAPLDEAGPDELSFLTHPRYRQTACTSAAGAILVGPGSALGDRDLLEAAEPYMALATLMHLFFPAIPARPGVSPDARLGQRVELGADVHVGPFAVIGDDVVLGDRAVVGAGSVIGAGCRIGSAAELKPRVVLYPGVWLGAGCLVHAGVVLGADGFGFATSGGRQYKLPQAGRVVVEDDVEIGANSTVDRAMLGETRIGRGSKLDDLVLIAHGVRIGEDSLLAGQAGVAGSSRLGARTRLAGQVGVAGHLDLGDGVTVAAKSAVFDDVPAGAMVSGVPAFDHRGWRRSQVLFRRLPELAREVRELRERVVALEKRLAGEE